MTAASFRGGTVAVGAEFGAFWDAFVLVVDIQGETRVTRACFRGGTPSEVAGARTMRQALVFIFGVRFKAGDTRAFFGFVAKTVDASLAAGWVA